jgi:hypothetical protein
MLPTGIGAVRLELARSPSPFEAMSGDCALDQIEGDLGRCRAGAASFSNFGGFGVATGQRDALPDHELRRSTPNIGAEILGVDLSNRGFGLFRRAPHHATPTARL